MFTLASSISFKPVSYPGVVVHLRAKSLATRTSLHRALVPYQERLTSLMIAEEKIRDAEAKLAVSDRSATGKSVNTPIKIEIPGIEPDTDSLNPLNPVAPKGLLPSENDIFTPHPSPPPPPERVPILSDSALTALSKISRESQLAVEELMQPAFIRTYVKSVEGLAIDNENSTEPILLTTADDILLYAPSDLIESIVQFIQSLPDGLSQDQKLNLERRSTSVSGEPQVDAQTQSTPAPTASTEDSTKSETVDTSQTSSNAA